MAVQATRRQLLGWGGAALAGAAVSGLSLPSLLKSASAAPAPSQGGGLVSAATATASSSATPALTPSPTPATVTIPVPVIQQSMVLDCETAALQQGLAYYGQAVSQAELFAQEYADTRLPVMGAGHSVAQWGNPYKQFVGYVNGSDWAPTGYGVYWPVILRLAQKYGVPNAIGGEGFTPASIYSELAAGHPVQIWIQTRFARVWLGTWIAWDGTPVRYSFAEHSVTLTGVSPTQVRVNDVLDATQYWVNKSLFEANFADFNNMAVIYRP